MFIPPGGTIILGRTADGTREIHGAGTGQGSSPHTTGARPIPQQPGSGTCLGEVPTLLPETYCNYQSNWNFNQQCHGSVSDSVTREKPVQITPKSTPWEDRECSSPFRRETRGISGRHHHSRGVGSPRGSQSHRHCQAGQMGAGGAGGPQPRME